MLYIYISIYIYIYTYICTYIYIDIDSHHSDSALPTNRKDAVERPRPPRAITQKTTTATTERNMGMPLGLQHRLFMWLLRVL